MHGTYKHLRLTTILMTIGYELCKPLRTLNYRINKLAVRSTWLLQGYIEYVYGWKDTSDAIEHYRANLDFGRTPVERQILSVLVNHVLVLWLVTIKRVGYGPGVTRPTHNRDKLRPRHIEIKLGFKKIVLIIWGLFQEVMFLDSVIVKWSIKFRGRNFF